MKYVIGWLLISLSWLPAFSQRSTYDPAAKHPGKQGGGFVDFALKQVNPQNTDYGCQIDEARKLLVDQTIKSLDSWAVLVALSFLTLSFFLLVHQHRERMRREIIAASLLAQFHNSLSDARSQAEEAIRRYNEMVARTNRSAEALLRTASQPPEHAQAIPAVPNAARDPKPQPASGSSAKDRIKIGENGAGRSEAEPQKREPEVDLIAQISTLQQQLNASHEREKNLQKELTKTQRRAPMAQAKGTNIAG